MAVERQRGLSQLANTRIAGQTQMAVEDLRQSGPEKALRATKIQGEIEDEKAARGAQRPAVGDQLWRSWQDQQGVEDGNRGWRREARAAGEGDTLQVPYRR